MLIQMLLTVLIIGMLIAGTSVGNVWTFVGAIAGIILLAWYARRVSGGIANLLLGDMSGRKVEQTYSLAQKYELDHDYEAAINEYLLAIKKNKKDPTPKMKLGNLYYQLGDYDNCLACMNDALRLSKKMSPEARCTLANRIADLYLQHKGDSASAVAVLKQITEGLPTSTYAEYARDRISQIEGND